MRFLLPFSQLMISKSSKTSIGSFMDAYISHTWLTNVNHSITFSIYITAIDVIRILIAIWTNFPGVYERIIKIHNYVSRISSR